ncbi:MAG: SDR family oxidoreductase [Woeseiaceae bacterium]|nr:SDR family oxidoreductase [Woeseiaceae bacterium]
MFERFIAALVLVVLAIPGSTQSSFAESADDNAQKAILVTGASSGIGLNITKTLAASGYFVYAGARKQADLEALGRIPNVQSVRLDVTKQDEIDAAVATVRAGGKGLYGLVNNAGILTLGPITEIDEDELAWILDVNLMGVYRVTKAFAPLIIESKGRICNISSIAGILSGMFWAPYNITKHALEAYTDDLAAEMALFDVQVSAINPGNYNSNIGTKEAAALAKQPYSQPGSIYAKYIAEEIEYMSDRSMYKDSDDVSAAIMHALFNAAPKPNYLVVPNQGEAESTIRKIIEETAELNADQEFSYSDDELIQMLKEATAVQRARGK